MTQVLLTFEYRHEKCEWDELKICISLGVEFWNILKSYFGELMHSLSVNIKNSIQWSNWQSIFPNPQLACGMLGVRIPAATDPSGWIQVVTHPQLKTDAPCHSRCGMLYNDYPSCAGFCSFFCYIEDGIWGSHSHFLRSEAYRSAIRPCVSAQLRSSTGTQWRLVTCEKFSSPKNNKIIINWNWSSGSWEKDFKNSSMCFPYLAIYPID